MAPAQSRGHRGDYTFYKWDEAGVCINPLPTPVLTQWGQCIQEFNYLRVNLGSLLALTLINSYSFFLKLPCWFDQVLLNIHNKIFLVLERKLYLKASQLEEPILAYPSEREMCLGSEVPASFSSTHGKTEKPVRFSPHSLALKKYLTPNLSPHQLH